MSGPPRPRFVWMRFRKKMHQTTSGGSIALCGASLKNYRIILTRDPEFKNLSACAQCAFHRWRFQLELKALAGDATGKEVCYLDEHRDK